MINAMAAAQGFAERNIEDILQTLNASHFDVDSRTCVDISVFLVHSLLSARLGCLTLFDFFVLCSTTVDTGMRDSK